jgi:hypothetical protein
MRDQPRRRSHALDTSITDAPPWMVDDIGNADPGNHISGGACNMNKPTPSNNDNDFRKGAVDDQLPGEHPQASLKRQLSHRNQDPMIKDADSDFPEPGQNPEHSGEPDDNAEGALQDRDPGQRQKRNQGDKKKDDPLVA